MNRARWLEPSMTALMSAGARGRHRLEADPPILDDVFALALAGGGSADVSDDPAARRARASTALRSRYAEDRLLGGDFTQYVLLGAGLDSFAWRRSGKTATVRLFEVDNAPSQRWKRSKAAGLGLPEPPNTIYVPFDLANEGLLEALAANGFATRLPTLFSLLGVAMYLDDATVSRVLGVVASTASGSEIVLSYHVTADLLVPEDRLLLAQMELIAASVGEPLRQAWTRKEVEQLVAGSGLELREHPVTAELQHRYFSGRTDGLQPSRLEGLLIAGAPEGSNRGT
jgi:methyltransferase (TIGR00027 family)